MKDFELLSDEELNEIYEEAIEEYYRQTDI